MTTIPLLTPEEIAVRSGRQAPVLHLPVRSEIFAEREIRLRELAADHAMRDYLLLITDLTRAQHALLQDYPDVALPDADALAAAVRAGRPSLPAELWPRDPRWRDGLHRLLEALLPRVPTDVVRSTVEALRSLDADALESQADRLLGNDASGLDLAAAPFIAAALQAYWTHLVLATQAVHGAERLAPFGRIEDATRCPCCGFVPVASVARIDATSGGLRYLQCALCSTQWHMVRIKCSHCESTKGIHYQSLERVDAGVSEPLKAAVEAETCDECGSYLKIVRKDRDPQVEPVADDLASLTLDLLVSEAGFERHGTNLLLLFGEPDKPDDGGGG
ncbi:MAG: formate dehydrogenase accessory protein FdhE [Aromatoleum sp.]|uniref:formate dehydrogenase accessory protein FdhE n=1 Tax=Aromatoleum sp. TaxID=2307007 RepID=UPI002893F9F3|nr:formate dehydrogenase accessory protein FdhE [Aromatoleum sp.]MDT3669490.1 formate dehydrogenase accessory protein FdhE [Aromatoleum sp.]